MKHFGHFGSIEKNSNKIISNSESDWRGVREGTSIRFLSDKVYYTVAKTEPLFYIRDFTFVDPGMIKLAEDSGLNILVRDYVSLSYKEYELNSVSALLTGGFGYKVGERVSFDGGNAAIDITTNSPTFLSLLIKEVGPAGEIIKFDIENRGKYLVAPAEGVTRVIWGSGKEALISANYRLISDRSIIEREVVEVRKDNGTTYLRLANSIPNISEGKLSVNKWIMSLTADYAGETKICGEYDIIRDYSPNFSIPLLAPNNPHPELVYNEAVKMVDSEMEEIFQDVQALKKELAALKATVKPN